MKLIKWGKAPCTHRHHNPPMHLYVAPGTTFTHVCPGCGEMTVIHGGPVFL